MKLKNDVEQAGRKPKSKAELSKLKRQFFWFLLLAIVWILITDSRAFLMLLAATGLFAVFIVVTLSILFFPPILWVLQPLKQADYPTARQRAKRIRFFPIVGMFDWEGKVLLFAGHYDKAEDSLREKLSKASEPLARADLLENLGYALLRQRRYAEASEALEEAIILCPDSASIHLSLADTYLESGEQPERSLELAQTALRLKKRGLTRLTDRYAWGLIYSDLAWAYALLGDQAAAEKAIWRAFRKTPAAFKPGVAGVYYRSGRAIAALGERNAACQYLERAVQIDPRGGYGNLAARALETLAAGESLESSGPDSDLEIVQAAAQASQSDCQDLNAAEGI